MIERVRYLPGTCADYEIADLLDAFTVPILQLCVCNTTLDLETPAEISASTLPASSTGFGFKFQDALIGSRS